MSQVRLAAVAVLVLIVSVMAVRGAAQGAAPCSAPLPSAPAAPTNVRIISAMLGLRGVPFGPFGSPDGDAGFAGAGAAAAAHDYFDQLANRPDCQAAYSLRSDAQVSYYRFGRGTYGPRVDYDPAVDAAKWQWLHDDESAEQIRLPIRLDRPASGTSRLLIVSDHMWDSAWYTEFKDPVGGSLGGWKWLQVTSMTGVGSTRSRIWFEPQMRWIGDMHDLTATVGGVRTKPFESLSPMPLSSFSAREYLGPAAPTTNDGVSSCGLAYGGDALAPIQSCFKSYPNTWTRTWIELKATAGQNYTEISWWMADENQDPVPVLLNARQLSYPPHTEFWFEYNTSAEARRGAPMAAWGRNVVVLKDVANPTALLARPVR